jgi:hypothetical protein
VSATCLSSAGCYRAHVAYRAGPDPWKTGAASPTKRTYVAFVAYRGVPISGKPDRVPPTKRKPFRAYVAYRAFPISGERRGATHEAKTFPRECRFPRDLGHVQARRRADKVVSG